MPKSFVVFILSLLVAFPALAKQDIRIDPDYDPRIELRIVVLPATKDRSLRQVNAGTISALLATELLRVYKVIDLDRFEQYLTDKGLTLEDALSSLNETVIRDSARVDALADVEIYRWDSGTSGIPLLGSKKGHIGVRVRIMDPYTGRIYWSINRLENVSPGANFLDRTTLLFRQLVTDLKERLDIIAEQRNKEELAVEQLAEGAIEPLPSKGKRVYSSSLRVERGFIPSIAHRYGEDVLKPVKAAATEPKPAQPEQTSKQKIEEDTRASLPPLFESSYEDTEPNAPPAPSLDRQRDLYLTPPELRRQGSSEGSLTSAPPIPRRFLPSGELLPPLQLQPGGGEPSSPPDTTQGNRQGTGS
ncbi:MAG: hypothetical protein V2A56_03530 [bacterium]